MGYWPALFVKGPISVPARGDRRAELRGEVSGNEAEAGARLHVRWRGHSGRLDR